MFLKTHKEKTQDNDISSSKSAIEDMVTELVILRCDSIDSDEKEAGNGDGPTARMTTELSEMEQDSTEEKSAGDIEKYPHDRHFYSTANC